MLIKILLPAAIALLAGVASAQSPSDKSALPEYPPCSAKITDRCIERKAVAKAPVRKAARQNKIVRRDKVHRRKG